MKIFDKLEQRRAWSDDEVLIRKSVRRLCDDVIAPAAAEYDRTGEFPWPNVKAINGLGLNGLFVPEAYGGNRSRFRLYLSVVQMISEACASTGIIYATTFHGMGPLIEFGNEEQKKRLLPRIAAGGLGSLGITEPTAGSAGSDMKTRSLPDRDAIVIDGGKIFISTGDVADLILLFGKWTEIDDPRRAISTLILEKGTPGFSVVRTEEKMGMRASATAALSFDGCRVPRANLLGTPGDGLRVFLGSLKRPAPRVCPQRISWARRATVFGFSWPHSIARAPALPRTR